MKHLTTPLDEAIVRSLHAGDHVMLSGVVYTARDAAHLRMMELIKAGRPLPLPLEGQVIYYAGPTPTPPASLLVPLAQPLPPGWMHPRLPYFPWALGA